jgi:hypothetical protein
MVAWIIAIAIGAMVIVSLRAIDWRARILGAVVAALIVGLTVHFTGTAP